MQKHIPDQEQFVGISFVLIDSLVKTSWLKQRYGVSEKQNYTNKYSKRLPKSPLSCGI